MRHLKKIISYLRLSKTIIIITFTLAFYACKKTEKLDVTKFLNETTFKNDLKIEGQGFNGLLIDNCTFDGALLSISDVDTVIIRNCTFKNQKGNGIKIGFGGLVNHIVIEKSSFINIGSNGIDSHEESPNGVIKNCYFENCALSDIGAAMGQAHHAIYWKGKNVKILNNEIHTGEQNYGNAISHRSSGLISGNKIFEAKKYGIMYFADHPSSNSLVIENNFLINCENGIGLTTPSNISYHNKNIDIRFNSIYNSKVNSIYVAADFENSTIVNITGNIIVQPEAKYIKTFYAINQTQNLESSVDIGFIDAENGDLHLNNTSSAIDFCSGLSNYPTHDIDGQLRNIITQDAGADEKH